MRGSGILIVHIIVLLWVALELWSFTWYEQSSIGCVYGTTGRAWMFGIIAGMFAVTQCLFLYYDVAEESTNVRVTNRGD